MRVVFNCLTKREKSFLPNYYSLKFLFMKKRDLLLAGLVLFNVSAFAQDGPTRYSDDAKVIFTQDFEDAPQVFNEMRLNPNPKRPTTLYTWNEKPVDSIMQVAYYVKSDSVASFKISKPSDMQGEQFVIAGLRDSVIMMYDGVMRTDAAWPDDSALQWDGHFILEHDGESQHGDNIGGAQYGLDRYGEDGGTQYFRYKSATSKGVANRGGSDDSGDHYVPEYRRNLFVRNIPIEENSSYRVTVFVKPTRYSASTKIKPRIGLDLMRGYFHSEKSFLVDLIGKETTTWYGAKTTEFPTFSDKTDYTTLDEGQWNKITLMAYYNSDEVGNASPYLLSYYWQTDWDWKVNVDEKGMVAEEGTPKTLRYIQQPDKYFVRLSFRSDSTIFDVDNLSLTKSWIGGVEYYNEMIRVDMGYETNLGKLAADALEENKIASVELPGKYFDVWGRWEDDHHWEQVPILSAEYQGDGFMYMWTEPEEDGTPFTLDVYDSLLVSFTNPQDPALRLMYTGDRYPNGVDSAWAANKENRVVFDFHNEIAYLNPTIMISPVTGKAVRSLAELAPVLQRETIVDGAFGLASDTRELTFKFSKNLSFDNLGQTSNKTTVTLTGNGVTEYWDIKEYPEDAKGFTTIERPAQYDTPLQGDYVLNFRKVTHLKNPNPDRSEDYGQVVNINYHFGDFDTEALAQTVTQTDWRSEVGETGYNRTLPASLYIHASTDAFRKGDNTNNGGKCGIYFLDAEGLDNCGFYFGTRNKDVTANVYTILNLEKGSYIISFKAAGWDDKKEVTMYGYPKPDQEILDGNENGFAILNAVANKSELGKFKPATQLASGNVKDSRATGNGNWPDGVETFEFKFNVPATGEYVIEWSAAGTDYKGTVIGNYTISKGGSDNSFASVNRVNTALAAAQAKLNAAAAAQYQGTDYNNLETVKQEGDGFIAAKKATKINLPAEYEAEGKVIDEAVKALQLHMDTVDAFNKALADAQAKLALYDADTLKAYKDLVVVGDLQTVVTRFGGYDFSAQAPGQINADTKILLDAIKAVEDRQALNDKLNDTKTEAAAVLLANAKYSALAAYVELEDAIASANGFDAISAVDEEIVSTTDALAGAIRSVKMISYASITTKRIAALNSLATTLGVEFDSDTKASIADAVIDDDVLAEVMKAKITEAIYNRVNDGNNKPLDLSAFIKNYYLYATPIINNVEKVKDNGNNINEFKNNIATPGAQIQQIEHRWNTNNVWLIILDQEFDNLYPGWTITSDGSISGNRYVTPDDEGNPTFATGDESKYMVFDGQLAMDWNSKAEMKQVVTGLPIGTYSLGINLKNNGKPASTSLNAIVGDVTYEGKNPEGTGVFSVDSILVGAEGVMAIDFILASGDNWSKADNFSLTFTPLAGFDYSTVATVVDFAQAEIASGEYEYYTLTWIKVEAPEKGQVYFRKSGNVVEKIIFK